MTESQGVHQSHQANTFHQKTAANSLHISNFLLCPQGSTYLNNVYGQVNRTGLLVAGATLLALSGLALLDQTVFFVAKFSFMPFLNIQTEKISRNVILPICRKVSNQRLDRRDKLKTIEDKLCNICAAGRLPRDRAAGRAGGGRAVAAARSHPAPALHRQPHPPRAGAGGGAGGGPN